LLGGGGAKRLAVAALDAAGRVAARHLARVLHHSRVDDPDGQAAGGSQPPQSNPERLDMPSRTMPELALQLVSVSESAPRPSRRTSVPRHELCFSSLYRQGRALAFPCDESGDVDIDALPPAARRNYLEACEKVGREFALPQVRPMAGFTH